MKPNKNKRPDYFDTQIQRSPLREDFLNEKNARDLQMDAVRIFRDIARGNLKIEEHAHYFENNQLLESCLVTANSKYNLHHVSFLGVQALIDNMMKNNQQPGQNIISVHEYHKRCSEGYNIIIQNLIAMKNTGNTVGCLLAMENNLFLYRNEI